MTDNPIVLQYDKLSTKIFTNMHNCCIALISLQAKYLQILLEEIENFSAIFTYISASPSRDLEPKEIEVSKKFIH